MELMKTFQEWKKACADIAQTEGFPTTKQGEQALPYMTGRKGIIRDVNETQQQWQSRCWEQYKQDNL